MKIRKTIAAIAAAGAISLAAACGATTTGADTTSSGTSSSSTTTQGQAGDRGPGGGVDVGSVITEAQLIALIQEAYGDASLGLHRGHQPVADVLNEVLTISHDELHAPHEPGAEPGGRRHRPRRRPADSDRRPGRVLEPSDRQ